MTTQCIKPTASNLARYEEDTHALSCFLQTAVGAIFDSETTLTVPELYGFNQVFTLINERLDATSELLASMEVAARSAKEARHD